MIFVKFECCLLLYALPKQTDKQTKPLRFSSVGGKSEWRYVIIFFCYKLFGNGMGERAILSAKTCQHTLSVNFTIIIFKYFYC